MLMQAHTVSWTRVSRTGVTEDGRPLYSNESGFPRSVKGSFQPGSRQSAQQPRGLDNQIDAVFFSDSYADGRVGDIVTFLGTTYTVVKAEPYPGTRSEGYDHIRYELTKAAG